MIADAIRFLLVNFTITLFVVGLIAAGVRIARAGRDRTPATITGAVLDWFLFFSVGVSFAWNGIVHSVFGDFSARLIGWPQSPFQLELAFCSFGFALVGFIAFSRRADVRTKAAAIVAFVPLLWGAAGGHLYQLFAHGDTAAGNAGVILWTDLLLPVFALVVLALYARAARRARTVGRHETDDTAAPGAVEAGAPATVLH